MGYRPITGTLMRSDGAPMTGATVTLRRDRTGWTPDDVYPPDEVRLRADGDGELRPAPGQTGPTWTDPEGGERAQVWASEGSDRQSRYAVRVGGEKIGDVTVPEGDGPLTLQELITLGGIEPDEQFQTVAAWIEANAAIHGANASTLEPGSEATASVEVVADQRILQLGVPRGDVGPEGLGVRASEVEGGILVEREVSAGTWEPVGVLPPGADGISLTATQNPDASIDVYEDGVLVGTLPPGEDGIGVPDPSAEPDDRWLRTEGGGLVYEDRPQGVTDRESSALALNRVVAYDTLIGDGEPLGDAPSGGTWEILQGTGSRGSAGASGGGNFLATLDPGLQHISIEADVRMHDSGVTRGAAIAFWVVDADNFWFFYLRRGSANALWRVRDGSTSTIATSSWWPLGGGHMGRAEVLVRAGVDVHCRFNGADVFDHSLSTDDEALYSSATKCGIHTRGGTYAVSNWICRRLQS